MPLHQDEIIVIETHIDDMNPEILGFVMDILLDAGALDVAYAPIQMKKNRPGVRLTVISPAGLIEQLSRMIMTETSAIGVRHYPAHRFKMDRSEETRMTSLGEVSVKVIRDGERLVRVAPEYEECRRIALEQGLPLIEVYRIIERETGSTRP
jgi:uncharacterized protein (DUF111 family)